MKQYVRRKSNEFYNHSSERDIFDIITQYVRRNRI